MDHKRSQVQFLLEVLLLLKLFFSGLSNTARTRKHSSRMSTTCLETVRTSVSRDTTRGCSWGQIPHWTLDLGTPLLVTSGADHWSPVQTSSSGDTLPAFLRLFYHVTYPMMYLLLPIHHKNVTFLQTCLQPVKMKMSTLPTMCISGKLDSLIGICGKRRDCIVHKFLTCIYICTSAISRFVPETLFYT